MRENSCRKRSDNGDRTETKNLAAEYPEKMEAMIKRWKEMAEELKVYPKPGR